jgi:hypothetical protein
MLADEHVMQLAGAFVPARRLLIVADLGIADGVEDEP